jgi:hypothetical protein
MERKRSFPAEERDRKSWKKWYTTEWGQQAGALSNGSGFRGLYVATSFRLLPSKNAILYDAILIAVSLFFSRGNSENLCEAELPASKGAQGSIEYG